MEDSNKNDRKYSETINNRKNDVSSTSSPNSPKESIPSTVGDSGGKDLLSGSTLIFLANILISLSGFILAAILMHNMPDYMYGLARSLQRAISISTIVTLKGIGNALVIHLSKKRKKVITDSKIIIGSMFFTVIIGVLAAIAVFLILQYLVVKQQSLTMLGNIGTARLFFGLIAVFPVVFLVSALSNSLLGLKRVKHNAIAIGIQSIGNLAFTTLFVYLGLDTFSVILGIGAGSLCSVLYSLFFLRDKFLAFFKEGAIFKGLFQSFGSIRMVLTYSSPLTIAAIFSQLFEGASILIILIHFQWKHLAFVQIAYYNYVQMLVIAARMPQESVGRMLLRHLKDYTVDDAKKQIHQAIRLVMVVSVPINLLIGYFSDEILEILAFIIRSKGFWLEAGHVTITNLLQLLIIGTQLAGTYYILMNCCASLDRPTIPAKVEFTGLIAFIFLSLFLIPAYGVLAVGIAYICAFVFMMAYALISMVLHKIIDPKTVLIIVGLTIAVPGFIMIPYFIELAFYWRALIFLGGLLICFLGIIRICKKDIEQATGIIKNLLGMEKSDKDLPKKELESN
jgi:O-antigen/teichoic acid export membrane protein